MLPSKPTAEQIRERRVANECSIFEAKADALQDWRRQCLRQLRSQAGELYTVEACRDVIVDLLDLINAVEHED